MIVTCVSFTKFFKFSEILKSVETVEPDVDSDSYERGTAILSNVK